jgi:hypothetical protein
VLGPLAQQGVEQLLPGRSMRRRGIGHHTVHVEQHRIDPSCFCATVSILPRRTLLLRLPVPGDREWLNGIAFGQFRGTLLPHGA